MPRIFITAFEPYGTWNENASWLALIEFTKQLSPEVDVTTRLYPVNFDDVASRLKKDLLANYDYALHLGQAPGTAAVKLEAIGLNIGGRSEQRAEDFRRLVEDGPVAYQSALPLAAWSRLLRADGIPTSMSYNAGSYLCNATLYLSHYFADTMELKTRSAFIHLPLNHTQTIKQNDDLPAMSSEMAAKTLGIVVRQLAKPALADAQELA